MARLQPVRGTRDLLPEDCRRHRRVIETARTVAERYGFGEIATPIFEFTEVFERTLGDTSDIVTKEMYALADRGGDRITLRPENTAGVARALVSGGLSQHLPLRFFYNGPMFRYERPQKGRFRQFHQIGIEILGVPEPIADIESIALATHILDLLGVRENTRLELNSLGDSASRDAYRGALVDYLRQRRDDLSEESLERLDRNPLRILDSKDEGDRRAIAEAPVMTDYLNQESAAFFKAVRDGLDRLGIDYEVSPHLVRGLDYYCHTAYEFTTEELGAQGAVVAGGRYDGLVESMGGPPTAGVGWAAGIERLAMLLSDLPAPKRPLALIALGQEAEMEVLKLADDLRRAEFVVELTYRGNLKKRLRQANKVNASVAVLIGSDELEAGEATVRDLDSGQQERVPISDLKQALERYR